MKPDALIADNLVAGYVPGFPIVQGASIRAGIGEVVVIIGPNGAGKSTLVKAIAGLVAIESGSVRLAGSEIATLPAEARIARGLGFVPQTGNVFTTLTIEENLIAGAHTVRAGLKDRLAKAYQRFPDLAAKRRARAGTLSGGQRQMLAIARALMTEPSVIMLDEPTAGLAPIIVGQVFADCRRLAESGVAVVIVEQNAKAALRLADRGYVLAEGRNFADGRAAELLADRALAEAFLGARRLHAAGAA